MIVTFECGFLEKFAEVISAPFLCVNIRASGRGGMALRQGRCPLMQ
jgi:hypothetical protein